jgi:uncharacterized membrane protein (UPF0127 family)
MNTAWENTPREYTRGFKLLLWAIPTISAAIVFALILYGVALNDANPDRETSNSGRLPQVFLDNPFIADTNQANTTARINGDAYTLEVVRNRAARMQGLGGRENLASSTGMLFVFPESGYHSIWMKEMNFAIDIIWLNQELQVVDVKRNALPESYENRTTYSPRQEARYVIELPAGSI